MRPYGHREENRIVSQINVKKIHLCDVILLHFYIDESPGKYDIILRAMKVLQKSSQNSSENVGEYFFFWKLQGNFPKS